ncbi:MAG: hypothetical protein ACXWC6_03560 [Ramlibacter sp.]
MARNFRWWIAVLLAGWLAAAAEPVLGPQALRARHEALAPALARSEFGAPVQLVSTESGQAVQGDVYAIVAADFGTVAPLLADPAQWCGILLLHLNTKHCRASGQPGRIELRVGSKHEQAVRNAALLDFHWHDIVQRDDYLAVQMEAPDGPYDTHDYRLVAEAVPLQAGRTFLHLGYAFGYAGGSRVAMSLYLATVGRSKVGFTRVPSSTGEPVLVQGMRGVVERNAVRYYLAIDAWLAGLAVPDDQRLDRRLAVWFDATERYPRQLHEIDRGEYLDMKHKEFARQAQMP